MSTKLQGIRGMNDLLPDEAERWEAFEQIVRDYLVKNPEILVEMSNALRAKQESQQAENDKTLIEFQDGPVNEAGVNGLTHEVLLAIVADRLRSFQQGPFASRYNALALTHIEDAQNWLNRRTLERMRRGVEGTHKA